MVYKSPLGSTGVTYESESKPGEFYLEGDVSKVYYKVFNTTSRQYELLEKDNFLRGLYAAPSDVKALKQQLGYSIVDGSVTPDFIKDIEKAQSSISSVNGRLEAIGQSGFSLGSYLAQSKSTTGGTTSTATVTDKNRAAQELLDTAKDYLGSDLANQLSKADVKSYVNELNSLERKRPTISRPGQTVAGGLTANEKEQLALKYIGKYVTAEGIKNAGGTLGSNYRTVSALAGNNGVNLDKAALRGLVLESVTSANGLENVKTKINNLAQVKYRALTPYLNQGLTVKDIASEYISRKAQLLELNPTAIRIDTDPDIQSALSGDALVPLYQFEKSLRQNPLWAKTNNAREEAFNYVNTILQDFGKA